MVDTIELDYQHLIIESGQPELLAKFYDWLRDKEYTICEWTEYEDVETGYYPIHKRPEELFAEFFGIDLNKIEAERRAILEELRSNNE